MTNKPKIIRVLDATVEADRKYAEENLIGCWVGISGKPTPDADTIYFAYTLCSIGNKGEEKRFCTSRGDIWRFIIEFSNSRPTLKCNKCQSKCKEVLCLDCSYRKLYFTEIEIEWEAVKCPGSR